MKIGAGTSLPGLVAAKIGARKVILCDNPNVDRWHPLIQETISSNSMIADRIHLEFLDWYDEKSTNHFIDKCTSDQWDFIFGSDIFFHKKGRYRSDFMREQASFFLFRFRDNSCTVRSIIHFGITRIDFSWNNRTTKVF